jgi:hypothetical protein
MLKHKVLYNTIYCIIKKFEFSLSLLKYFTLSLPPSLFPFQKSLLPPLTRVTIAQQMLWGKLSSLLEGQS